MSFLLRILLIIAAFTMAGFVFSNVKKAKLSISRGLPWVLLGFLVLLLSLFPDVAYALSYALGFQAPINFVFLFFIAVLLVKGFLSSVHVSQLENKVKELSQQVAIDRLDHYVRTHNLSK